MLNFDINDSFDGSVDIPEHKLKNIKATIIFKQGKLIDINLFFDTSPNQNINDSSIMYFNFKKGSICLADLKASQYNNMLSSTNYSFFAKKAIFTYANNFDWNNFKINKISLHTSNLNRWLFFSLPEDYVEKIKEIDNYKSQININNIQYNKHKLSIYDNFIYIKDNKKEDLYRLIAKGYITIEDKDTNFNINEASILIGDIELLLCVLTGYPQSPITVKFNENMFFYQTNGSHIKVQNPDSHLDFIFWFNILNQKNNMQDILINFFAKTDIIKKTYRGLWGLINNPADDFYDDVFFRIFAMLDCITKNKSEDIKIPFSDEQKADIKNVLANIIEKQMTNFPDYNDQYSVIKERIIESVDYSNGLSYKNRIQYIMKNYLSVEATEIISIDDKTLSKIVKLRNSFAHLNELPDFFYTEGYQIYNKTLLLIFYLLWKELGINDKVIFANLNRTFNTLKQACSKQKLDVYNGTPLISLSDGEFNKLLLIKHGHAIPSMEKTYSNIILEKIKDLYSINVEMTNAFQKNIYSKKYASVKDYVISLYSPQKYNDITYVSDIWIENRRTQLNIHGAIIIDFSKK